MARLQVRSVEDLANFLEYAAIAKAGTPLGLDSLGKISTEFTDAESHMVSLALTVLNKRRAQLGEKYPFRVSNEYILSPRGVRDSFYYLFVCLTPRGPVARSPELGEAETGSIFESLTQQCFTDFFGAGTATLNFGYNTDPTRPGDFDSAVRWAADRIGVPLGAGYRQPRRKDGGVDLFVWKTFADRFPGNVLMLMQCTVMDDFVNKISDIDKRLWASWLSSDIDPVISLAIPGIVTDLQVWAEINTRGMLFDRIRLTTLSTNTPTLRPGEEAYFSSFEQRLERLFQ